MTSPRIGNLREYLASTGATGALIAGAMVAFLSAGALVAFNGAPLGGDDADGSVSLADQPGGIAPERAAAALRTAPGAVADRPFGGSVLAAAGPGTGGSGPGGSGTNTSAVPVDPLGGSGGVPGAVDGITGGTGLPSVGDPAGPVTGPVDDAVNDVANGAGGLLGGQNSGNGAGNGLGGLLGD